ncbi:MAG: LysR family transcriptional regulator [Rhodobacteraceae bacterium]|nr:LysR family transcriptional regulator [Paracoccaceae bacterium]
MRRLSSLTFKQLRALRAVVELRSISRAAEVLGLTPPAVHSQLKALEDIFCCPLLIRDGPNGFTPTPEGEALLTAFDRMQASLNGAVRRIDALRSGLAGSVVLGVVSTGKYYAPKLVAQLKDAFPDIEVLLRIGNRDSILTDLQASAIDLAIMGRPPRDPPVVAHAIGDHPHVLIVPPGHRLSRLDTIAPADILSEPIIAREQGSGTRILATRFLDRIGEGAPYETIEMGSNETIKQAVIAGLGIALISLHTVTEELRAGRLVTVTTPDLPIVRRWYILHRLDSPPVGAVATVLDFINAQRGSFLPDFNHG